MDEVDLTLDWIINRYGIYFQKFNITSSDIVAKYSDWCKSNDSKQISDYLFYLLSTVGLFIAKSADSVRQGLEWKIEYGEKMLEYCNLFQKSEVKYWTRQIKFDKEVLRKEL